MEQLDRAWFVRQKRGMAFQQRAQWSLRHREMRARVWWESRSLGTVDWVQLIMNLNVTLRGFTLHVAGLTPHSELEGLGGSCSN